MSFVFKKRLQIWCAYVHIRLDGGMCRENIKSREGFNLPFHFLTTVTLKWQIKGLCLHEAEANKNAVCVQCSIKVIVCCGNVLPACGEEFSIDFQRNCEVYIMYNFSRNGFSYRERHRYFLV